MDVTKRKDLLQKINTITKYPSILTYHKRGNKGLLTEELTIEPTERKENVLLTEKVDGTSTRLIFMGDDYIIGSREELLYAKGDRIENQSLDIVENVKETAESMSKALKLKPSEFVVFYGETYGATIGKNRKNYSQLGNAGFRVFDAWKASMRELNKLLEENSLGALSSWRQKSQPFMTLTELISFCEYLPVSMVPVREMMPLEEFPKDREEVLDILEKNRDTLVGLDVHAQAEGLVLRTDARDVIAKLRLEDYRRVCGVRK